MCHQFYIYCAERLMARFFTLKRLKWHLKNIWDEKYSRWIISLISIITKKLMITVYNWLMGIFLKSWATIKILLLQGIIYITKRRKLIIKATFACPFYSSYFQLWSFILLQNFLPNAWGTHRCRNCVAAKSAGYNKSLHSLFIQEW